MMVLLSFVTGIVERLRRERSCRPRLRSFAVAFSAIFMVFVGVDRSFGAELSAWKDSEKPSFALERVGCGTFDLKDQTGTDRHRAFFCDLVCALPR
jgi:hypothetical protein